MNSRFPSPEVGVTLRFAFPDDASQVAKLSALDSAAMPAEPVLLAEVGGELRAALSLADGAVVADPFHETTPLIELLAARASQLSAERSGAGRWRLRLARLGLPALR
jgi:hypothetical protein